MLHNTVLRSFLQIKQFRHFFFKTHRVSRAFAADDSKRLRSFFWCEFLKSSKYQLLLLRIYTKFFLMQLMAFLRRYSRKLELHYFKRFFGASDVYKSNFFSQRLRQRRDALLNNNCNAFTSFLIKKLSTGNTRSFYFRPSAWRLFFKRILLHNTSQFLLCSRHWYKRAFLLSYLCTKDVSNLNLISDEVSAQSVNELFKVYQFILRNLSIWKSFVHIIPIRQRLVQQFGAINVLQSKRNLWPHFFYKKAFRFKFLNVWNRRTWLFMRRLIRQYKSRVHFFYKRLTCRLPRNWCKSKEIFRSFFREEIERQLLKIGFLFMRWRPNNIFFNFCNLLGTTIYKASGGFLQHSGNARRRKESVRHVAEMVGKKLSRLQFKGYVLVGLQSHRTEFSSTITRGISSAQLPCLGTVFCENDATSTTRPKKFRRV